MNIIGSMSCYFVANFSLDFLNIKNDFQALMAATLELGTELIPAPS